MLGGSRRETTLTQPATLPGERPDEPVRPADVVFLSIDSIVEVPGATRRAQAVSVVETVHLVYQPVAFIPCPLCANENSAAGSAPRAVECTRYR